MIELAKDRRARTARRSGRAAKRLRVPVRWGRASPDQARKPAVAVGPQRESTSQSPDGEQDALFLRCQTRPLASNARPCEPLAILRQGVHELGLLPECHPSPTLDEEPLRLRRSVRRQRSDRSHERRIAEQERPDRHAAAAAWAPRSKSARGDRRAPGFSVGPTPPTVRAASSPADPMDHRQPLFLVSLPGVRAASLPQLRDTVRSDRPGGASDAPERRADRCR